LTLAVPATENKMLTLPSTDELHSGAMNPLPRAVLIFGSQAALARAISKFRGEPCTRQQVSRWLKDIRADGLEHVPTDWCFPIEEAVDEELPRAIERAHRQGLTTGEFRRVTREELKPSVFRRTSLREQERGRAAHEREAA